MEDIADRLKHIPDTDETVSVSPQYDELEVQLNKERLRKLKLENDLLAGQKAGDSQDREQRKNFAVMIFILVAVYMSMVFVVLFFSGFDFRSFGLSDGVLMALLGTTTANVIGVLIIVVTYLFSRKKKSGKED